MCTVAVPASCVVWFVRVEGSVGSLWVRQWRTAGGKASKTERSESWAGTHGMGEPRESERVGKNGSGFFRSKVCNIYLRQVPKVHGRFPYVTLREAEHPGTQEGRHAALRYGKCKVPSRPFLLRIPKLLLTAVRR